MGDMIALRLAAVVAGSVLAGSVLIAAVGLRVLAGWSRVDLAAWTGNGIRDGRTKTDGNRVECPWSNREFPQAHLFDLDAGASA